MNLTNMYATLRMIEGEEFSISEVDQLNQMYTIWPTLMAGVLLVILPLIVMYLFLQRRFMKSIERTGLV